MDVLAEYEKENNIPHSESRVNEAWVEVAEAERESKVASSEAPSTFQPPPLRRQSDNSPVSPVNEPLPSTTYNGPPPLVNSNNVNSIAVSSTS